MPAFMRIIFSDLFLIIFIAAVVALVGYYSLGDLSLKNPWVDRLAHFAGGFWAAAIFIYVFRHYPELHRFAYFLNSKILFVIFVLGFSALIGVLWEFNEFIFDSIGDLVDTIEDLFLDLFGGLVAAFLGFFYKE